MAPLDISTASSSVQCVLDRALAGHALEAEDGYALGHTEGPDLAMTLAAASRLNDTAHANRVVSYSRKVFIPLTNLCRDRCGYCTFVKAPGHPDARTMTADEVLTVAREGAAQGCKEALFSLGDHPEWRHPEMSRTLHLLGYASTPEYTAAMSRLVLQETGLLPHTNCGVLDREEMQALAAYNASLGIMLESTSRRLLEPGGPHYRADSKDPRARLATLGIAGELGVVMTTGILIGIGETWQERVDTLLAIRDLQCHYGNIQEVIVQNFRAKPTTRMRGAKEPSLIDMLRTLAVARLMLGPEMNIQAPPNLNADGYQAYLLAGINDWGGISPVTRDFINPEAPWPELVSLRAATADAGRRLRERLALYPEYITSPQWHLSPSVAERVAEFAGEDGLVRPELER